MIILPVSSLNSFNNIKYVSKSVNMAAPSDKQVSLKDITYSYPINFKGNNKEDMEQILKDSKWAKDIFKKYNMKAEIDPKDGLLILNELKDPHDNQDKIFQNSDIDVNRLFKNIKAIESKADFSFYENITLKNLKQVGGKLICDDANNINFPALTKANDIDCNYSVHINFPVLTKAKNIDCSYSESIDFPVLATANKIVCQFAESIDFSALTTANKIDCYKAKNIDFSALTVTNNIYDYGAKHIELPRFNLADNN